MPNYPMPELTESTLFEKTVYYDEFDASSKGVKYFHCPNPDCDCSFTDRGAARSCCGDLRREKKHKEQEKERRRSSRERKFIEAMNNGH